MHLFIAGHAPSQVPHPAVQCGQPAGVRATLPRDQDLHPGGPAAEDQRAHTPLALAAPLTGACVRAHLCVCVHLCVCACRK